MHSVKSFVLSGLVSFIILLAMAFGARIAMADFSVFTAPPTFADFEKYDPQLQNLLSRFSGDYQVQSGRKKHALLMSESSTWRSGLEDQALGVLAFVHAGEKKAAEAVLNELARLQNSDGSWDSAYRRGAPTADASKSLGSIAWVALACEVYDHRYGERYAGIASRALSYLKSQRTEVRWAGRESHPLRSSSDAVSFEQNLVAYAAFSAAPPSGENQWVAREIQSFLGSMWTGDRFYPTYSLKENRPDADAISPDSQSWAVLALGLHGPSGEDYSQGLKTDCHEFLATEPMTRQGVSPAENMMVGFTAHPKGRALASASPIVSEGSLGALMALKSAKAESCGGKSLQEIELGIREMTQEDGSIRDASSSKSTLASTAWRYFARTGYNPFRPYD